MGIILQVVIQCNIPSAKFIFIVLTVRRIFWISLQYYQINIVFNSLRLSQRYQDNGHQTLAL